MALKELSPLFEQMYSEVGRPSIPPERLLKASLLMALYTVRSERLLMEQLDYNLLFRWFVGLNMDEAIGTARCSPRTGSVAEADVAGAFFARSGSWREDKDCCRTSTSPWTAR